jgi:DNA polymerase
MEAAGLAAARVRERAQACADLQSLRTAVAGCTECGLCRTRTQTVFADGSPKLRLMFVGEAPGESEDLQGVPFVGKAGQLLTDIIAKGMRVARAEVYIANVLKCRPPENRDPTEAEKKMCTPWLDRQIELVDPAVIVALGRHAANHLLGLEGPRALSMGALRGSVHERNGRRIVATFHPAYLLRSPGEKKECWKDIQVAMALAGLAVPERKPTT